MNFDDIQKSWQAQPVNALEDVSQLKEGLKTLWEKHQRKTLRNNIWVTVSFIVTLAAIGWIYVAFNKQYGPMFTLSIIMIYVLLTVYLYVLWKGFAYRQNNLEAASQEYIDYQISKLNWRRKTITVYSWVYATILWIALVIYIIELTRTGSALFRYTALGITTAYAFGITWWGRFVKCKKQLIEIDDMTHDLQSIKDKLLA